MSHIDDINNMDLDVGGHFSAISSHVNLVLPTSAFSCKDI